MTKAAKRLTVLASALLALAILALALPALAASGDYGVATGSSSTCGGSGPPCVMTYNGHSLSYDVTNSDGSVSYQFDDFDCVAVVASNGWITLGGNECSSALATATPAPTATPEPAS